MEKSKNKEVQKFLEDTLNDDEQKYEILQELRKIVFSANPYVSERIMYGGIMFTLNSDIGGIFVYKNHISFEFSYGFKFKDPNKILEGNGKYRRHIKIKSFCHIKDKNVKFYVKQAIEISNS